MVDRGPVSPYGDNPQLSADGAAAAHPRARSAGVRFLEIPTLERPSPGALGRAETDTEFRRQAACLGLRTGEEGRAGRSRGRIRAVGGLPHRSRAPMVRDRAIPDAREALRSDGRAVRRMGQDPAHGIPLRGSRELPGAAYRLRPSDPRAMLGVFRRSGRVPP